ncbi:hypothetical protein PSEUDO8Z_150190 [Pseudomonas sp. 8Z]|nr:hypothetical protein PSEUDO8Z_150190 [Pseudomonas sp. 8Z]
MQRLIGAGAGIIFRLSVLLHKHPHELLDSVVKEQLVKSFVSTEAAHSTAAFQSVKLFFEVLASDLNSLRPDDQC